jgi:hypothetical protein
LSYYKIKATINWTVFDDAFEQHYSQDNDRPSKPIRLMVGLLILKQLENLSDKKPSSFPDLILYFLGIHPFLALARFLTWWK